MMTRILILWTCAAVLLCLASSAFAGPNSGGTLVVHDTGLIFSAGQAVPSSAAPDCSDLDTSLPLGLPAQGDGWVWRVYAAFPTTSAPRLKALAFAASFPDDQITIFDWEPPGPNQVFEIADPGWPLNSGAGTSISFMFTQTSTVTECYWLAGYCYEYAEPCTWALGPHAAQPAVFVDDAVPSVLDPITAFGSVGFGMTGSGPCPVGACCDLDGMCEVIDEQQCQAVNGAWQGPEQSCVPNPCPEPLGACCGADGHCTLMSPSGCDSLPGEYQGHGTNCVPSPCPPPVGACCIVHACEILTEADCLAFSGSWEGAGTACFPSPCQTQGEIGACCLPDGECILASPNECALSQGVFHSATLCDPNPCPATPTKTSSWGRIKATFGGHGNGSF